MTPTDAEYYWRTDLTNPVNVPAFNGDTSATDPTNYVWTSTSTTKPFNNNNTTQVASSRIVMNSGAPSSTGLTLNNSTHTYVDGVTFKIDSSAVSTISGGATLSVLNGGTLEMAKELRLGSISSAGTLNLQSGNLTVTDGHLLVGNGASSVGTLNVSGDSTLDIKSHFFLGDSNLSTGTATMTGGSLTAGNQVRVGNHGIGTMYLSGGTLTSTGIMYVGYGSAGSTLHLSGTGKVAAKAGLNIGFNADSKGTLNISGGTMDVAGAMQVNGADSRINFIAGPNGFGTLNVAGAYTDNVAGNEITVSGGGVALFKDYNGEDGITVMTVGSGTPGVASTSDLYRAEFSGGELVVTMNPNLGRGTLDATSSFVSFDQAAKGWVLLSGMDSASPYVVTMAVDGLEITDMTDFLRTLNDDLKVGEQQVLTASRQFENTTRILIQGLRATATGNNVFAWDFGGPKYEDFGTLGLRGIGSQEVPEPAAWLLLALAFVCVWRKTRR